MSSKNSLKYTYATQQQLRRKLVNFMAKSATSRTINILLISMYLNNK